MHLHALGVPDAIRYDVLRFVTIRCDVIRYANNNSGSDTIVLYERHGSCHKRYIPFYIETRHCPCSKPRRFAPIQKQYIKQSFNAKTLRLLKTRHCCCSKQDSDLVHKTCPSSTQHVDVFQNRTLHLFKDKALFLFRQQDIAPVQKQDIAIVQKQDTACQRQHVVLAWKQDIVLVQKRNIGPNLAKWG